MDLPSLFALSSTPATYVLKQRWGATQIAEIDMNSQATFITETRQIIPIPTMSMSNILNKTRHEGGATLKIERAYRAEPAVGISIPLLILIPAHSCLGRVSK
jgi:hypothetical protein